MKITILTLFPEMFVPLQQSILRRAQDAGYIKIDVVDFRDYADNKHKKVDDTPYGGGAGMVICAQPVVSAIESIDPKKQAHRIFLTPAAPTLTHTRVVELAQMKRDLILLCGHYEGIDQRAIALCIDEVISIGDYVLTGGEIPAMVLADAVARYVPGIIAEASLANESFTTNLLEHPQYTKPREFRGLEVPSVLFGGNHAEIEKWKKEEGLKITKKFRPDLMGGGNG